MNIPSGGQHIMPDVVSDAINAVRFLSADAVQKANSGHPGTPMALAPLAYVLYTRHVRHDPGDPLWPDRDRVILSAGHASMLLYSTLHLCGYDLTLDDIKSFRQWESRTPGHPERLETPGIEVTTGPLGQGFGNSVGMAVAERMLAARFNTRSPDIVDHRTWCIASDGDIMEGVASEAASLAGLFGLAKLTVFYDDNSITLSGPAGMALHEDVPKRFEAYGWHTTIVEDVNDLDALDAAIAESVEVTDKPSLVAVHSHIGYGSPLQDSYKAHGSPLGEANVEAAREALGWTHPPFEVPAEVVTHWRSLAGVRADSHARWNQAWKEYEAAEPALAAEFTRRFEGRLPDGWSDDLPTWPADTKAMATRKAGHSAENAVAQRVPELVGGSADLDPSTLTVIEGSGNFSFKDDHDYGQQARIERERNWSGRNIEYGVREHGMGSITNGIAAHGALRPFTATFFCFSDYMRPVHRLAAIMHVPTIFVYTHDSVGLGEDGPTHQPVEHLASLRAIPHLNVIRPADPNETMQAWVCALGRTDGPTALVLSRQSTPTLDPSVVNVAQGASVIADGDEVVLIGTGTEVAVALGARDLLAADGVSARVVSMPCWELFREQPEEVRDTVLPPGLPTVSVEAAVTFGWGEWADASVGIDRFGASAPGGLVMEKLGITPEHVAEAARSLLGREEDR